MSAMRSFSKQTTASVVSCRRASASRAWAVRRFPSKVNGSVANPITSAAISRAICAITGAAPEPVPPPNPVQMKIRRASASSKAARKGTPQLHFDRRDGAGERLDVGVGGNEIGLVHSVEHDAIECVRAGASDRDHLDRNDLVLPFRQTVVSA